VGAGTGVSTAELARSGAYAVGSDISLGMLAEGRRSRPQVPLLAGDALALPFADGAFDAVTISFALRNVVDVPAALREFARVTRPGGRLVVCEFSHPTGRAFRTAYLRYLIAALPAVARRVSSNPEAYVYLAESIRAWPDQRALAERIAATGWGQVTWRNLTGGIVALHRAVRGA
jgi:demethylmenaquinone methyltransferase/2-methoxy-6-polyprenyl-1,4-benzoquinol methylase